jgi:hypothetical protein
MNDAVNHPAHYQGGDAKCSKCGHPIECIDVVRHLNFNVGNAIKYLWRLGKKDDAVQELKKAAWYVADEIRRLGSAP